MAGIRALRKIQMGKEATSGTIVDATVIWRGMGILEDTQEVKFAPEDVGYLSGLDRTYIPRLGAKLSMDSVPATFEQLPYIFEAGIKTVNTGATDTGGSGKIYAYAMPTTSKNTIRTFTLEGGDDQQEEETEYCFVESFKLTGKAAEAWMVSADWVGRQVAVSSFTGSLTPPTVEEILFGKGLLYIDATTLGTTLKSNTLLAAEVTEKTGWIAVFSGDGALHFSFAKSTEPEVTLNITFEHDATAVAEKVAWRAKTRRLIRIKVTGNALATAGSGYSVKTLLLDFGGKWEKFDKIGEQNGNDVVQGTLRCRPSTTDTLYFTPTVVNETAVLA